MERGVGQHDPVILIARGHRGGDGAGSFFLRRTIGRSLESSTVLLFRLNPGELL